MMLLEYYPTSTSLGTLAEHSTNLVGFGALIAQARQRDVNPPGGPPCTPVPSIYEPTADKAR